MHNDTLVKISTHDVVFSKFRKDYPHITISVSTRKDKKYMIKHTLLLAGVYTSAAP